MRYGIIPVLLLLACGLLAAGCSSLSAEDQAFATQAHAALTELQPISADLSAAFQAEKYSDIVTIGTKLSTRSTFWRERIAPMSVTAKCADAKTALVLALDESALAGEGDAAAMRLYLDGRVAEATAKLEEALPHTEKATEYLKIAEEKLPK